jgi:hypothetical protein
MRPAVAWGAAALALALSGCASTPVPAPPPELPPDVGNGQGSQYGNYAAQEDGEMRLPTGERCVVYNWDRPFTKGYVIRYRSASCESTERAGWMVARDLGHTIVPIAESNLKGELDEAGE